MLNLQLGFKQQQSLTPQLQQAIYLLQLPTQALQQYLQEALNGNPLLEAEEGGASSVEVEESYIPYAPAYRKNEFDLSCDLSLPQCESLRDYLRWQLDLSPLCEEEYAIAVAIIDAIDEDGLLKRHELDISDDQLLPVLTQVQKFEPVGVAARDISECLCLQLEQLPEATSHLKAAKIIVTSHLKKLAIRDYTFLQNETGLSADELQQVIAMIQALNPKPGANYSTKQTQYVVPDVILHKVDKGWKVTINEAVLPKLSINQEFAAVIQDNESDAEVKAYQAYLQDAKLLIKNIQNRQDTLLKVSQYIVQQQLDFFEHGEQAMKPMILKDVADVLGFHESTISRTTSEKYLLTPNGIYELKYFFSSHIASSEGKFSATAIKASIKKLITEEAIDKPLSDNAIATALAEQGIKIARRTVTKYREALMIPVAKLRG